MTDYYEEVIDQLTAVRETRATNMFNKNGVRNVANQCGFDELVEFTKNCTSNEYMEHLEEMGRRQ